MTGYFFSSGTNLALFKDLLQRESKSIWVVSTVVALIFFFRVACSIQFSTRLGFVLIWNLSSEKATSSWDLHAF